MIVQTWEAAKALHLNMPRSLFGRHQRIGLLLNGICADFVPTAIDEFNATQFSGSFFVIALQNTSNSIYLAVIY